MKALKNILNTVRNKLLKATVQIRSYRDLSQAKLAENKGQFVMDHAVVFAIILVLGGIAMALLTTFMRTDMAPLLTQKVRDFFS